MRKLPTPHRSAQRCGATLVTPKTDHNLVFPNKRGDVVDNQKIQLALDVVQIAAGIVDAEGRGKYSPHKLWHFYASWCINAKTDGGLEWPIKKVSERLGHASIRMTADRYGHLFPRGDDAAELAAADAMFFDNKPAPRPATATVTVLRPHVQELPVEESPMPPPIAVETPQPQQAAMVAVLPEPEPEAISGEVPPAPFPRRSRSRSRSARRSLLSIAPRLPRHGTTVWIIHTCRLRISSANWHIASSDLPRPRSA